MSGSSISLQSRLCWIALLACLAGCAHVRLPAIDPSGRQIFLPQPSYTTFESPLSCLPRPAFPQPPLVPDCSTPVVVTPPIAPCQPQQVVPLPVAGPELAALQDRLLLSPARMVAPVNSEVILLAGICGPDGHYVTRQPIEWSLSQESVGQFVDVGESHHGRVHRLTGRPPVKMGNDFAVSRTSTAARQITRGTPSPNDDVWLYKGQAWVSVTSATQGISHVTAVAPGAENWEQRRQLARVHWVDAQWELPAPAVVRAGAAHMLTTKITRSSSSRPVTDWTVRYEWVSGVPITFGATGLTRIEQPTDANGASSVSVSQQAIQPGSSQIRITILSPADGDAPLEIGQGFTTIKWSAPGLSLDASGPEIGAPNATLIYRFQVTNPGDLPANNTRVTVPQFPPLLRFLNSDPPERSFGESVSWDLGTVAPGDTRTVEVRCRALREGTIRLLVRATADGLQAEDEVTTSVERPALEVRMVDAPQTRIVGQSATFNMLIVNVGRQRLTNVILTDTFDEQGLAHAPMDEQGRARADGERSPIERRLGDLEAGQSEPVAVTFVVQREGQYCHTLEARADGGYVARQRACVTGEAGNPAMEVRILPQSPRSEVGEDVEFRLEVRNVGDTPLSGIRLLNTPGRSLEPTWTNRDYAITDSGALLFQVDSIQPNETITRRVVCNCLAPDPAAENVLEVTTLEGLRERRTATIVIDPRRTRPSSASRDPERSEDAIQPIAVEPRSGQIQISIKSQPRQILVGETTTVFVDIKNDQDVAVKNVDVSFALDPGLDFVKFISNSAALKIHPGKDGRFQVDPIAELRPGGSRELRVVLRATQAGEQVFNVQIEGPETSERSEAVQVSMNGGQ